MMFTEGQIVKGQYRILGEIAQGELGPVYRAIDLNSRSACVLKSLCLNGAAEVEPLKQELEKIQALRHSNIASAGEVEETEDHQFFIHREFLDGVTLEEVIWKQAPLPLSRACTIAKQIARALESAHHAGIIHGNLTPSKVLLVSEEGEERIKVLGFGTLTLKKDRFIDLARLALRNGGAPVFGDPEYISPEQAVGMAADALDGRSDLYSLGVILYQMLTGDLPIEGSNAMETVLGHVFSEACSLRDRPELEIPEVIDTLVGRMLAKNRQDRPASATAVVDQLSAWEKKPERPRPAVIEPDRSVAAKNAAPAPEPAIQNRRISQHEQVIPEPQPTASMPSPISAPSPDAFIADLKPDLALSASGMQSDIATVDAQLDRSPEPAPARTPPRARPASHADSVIFKSYVVKKGVPAKKEPSHRWAVAILIVLILAGAGCGWLYETGRTYWFQPEFLKARISSFFSSGSSGNLPPVEEVPPQATPPQSGSTANESAPASSLHQTTQPNTPASGHSLSDQSQSTQPPASQPLHPLAPTPNANNVNQVNAATSSASGEAASSAQAHAPARIARKTSSARTKVFTPTEVVDKASIIRGATTKGDYYFDRGDYDEAIRAYQVGLSQDPSNQQLLADIERARRAKAAEAKYLGQ
jgi:serine/threonine protein kinase